MEYFQKIVKRAGWVKQARWIIFKKKLREQELLIKEDGKLSNEFSEQGGNFSELTLASRAEVLLLIINCCDSYMFKWLDHFGFECHLKTWISKIV